MDALTASEENDQLLREVLMYEKEGGKTLMDQIEQVVGMEA